MQREQWGAKRVKRSRGLVRGSKKRRVATMILRPSSKALSALVGLRALPAQCTAPFDHLVAANTLYGGTYSQFAVTFKKFGIDCTFVDSDDPENFRRALKPNTKALFAETIANPRLNVLDISAVAAIR